MLPLDRLIVVAAPSCCGKSTLINAIKDGDNAALRNALTISNPASWSYADAFYVDSAFLEKTQSSPTREMILHWTIPRPSLRLLARRVMNGFTYEKRERMSLIQEANQQTVITLFSKQAHLLRGVRYRREKVRERFQSGSSTLPTYFRQRWNMRMLERLYSNMRNVVPLYDRWFQFCRDMGVKNQHLVDLDRPTELLPQDHWQVIRKEWLGD